MALLITMTLVGFWHGANWTFVAFGFFNGLILTAEHIPFGKNNKTLAKILPKQSRLITVIYFFSITSISSIFFRSASIEQAWYMLKRIFTFQTDGIVSTLIGIKLSYLVLMIIAELLTRKWDFPLQYLPSKTNRLVRWSLYYLMIFFLIRYAEPKEAFIYFQF